MTYYHDGTSIQTAYDRKPGPSDSFDWTAVTNEYEPGHPIGYGPTELMAIIDLLDQLDEVVQ